MKRPNSVSCISFFLFPFSFFLIVVSSCHNKDANDAQSAGLPTSLINIQASASKPTDGNLPVISFTDTTFDFGTMKAGDKVSHSYTFTNKGKSDLLISAATSSCGCTIASIPKEVIHPGQSDKIDVKFDSEGKEGKVVKYVSVTSNCYPNTSYLTFTANILPTNN